MIEDEGPRPSFLAAGHKQLHLLHIMLHYADTQGYYILLLDHHVEDTILFSTLGLSMESWITQWGAKHGRRAIAINLRTTPLVDHKFVFWFRVPRRAGFKPVIGALNALSAKRVSRHSAEPERPAALVRNEMSEVVQYEGKGRDAFKFATGVLDTYREILTQGFRPNNRR